MKREERMEKGAWEKDKKTGKRGGREEKEGNDREKKKGKE